jgi:PAS domain S-box-containing protein
MKTSGSGSDHDGEEEGAGAPAAPRPGWNEADRLEALAGYAILDTPREPQFDDVARLAADVFEAPIAVVNLIAEGRQWFKAEVGIGADELPLDVSICAHAILQQGLFVVPDTSVDPRFICNPLVSGAPGLRFYAGALLETPDGLPIGTVCVLDTKPRPEGITERQRLTLEVLARQVMSQLEFRRAIAQRDQRAERLEREIEGRSEAESALHETTRRLDAILNNTRQAVFLMDEGQQCVYANAAAESLTGYAFEEMSGRPLHDVVHHKKPDGSHYPIEECPIDRAFPERAQMGGEELFVHKDGSFYPVGFTASPMLDQDGRPVGTVIEARNIADEIAAREGLARLAATLEIRVEERTRDLVAAQEALRQAQKMEAVGQLTGGIAHDFNNLLTGVIGSLDMMQRRIAQGQTDRIERYATAALTSANRAAALTHRLLAFARRQPLDPKPVDANRLVTGIEELLRRTIGETVRLEIVTAGGLWQTLCDPHQLESAIVNLAINARDAMPDGGTLTIETCNAHLDDAYAARQRDVTPGQYISICVSDTGEGMSAQVIEKAFDPFFTTKEVGQGTGLGLSMVYGFARQSEGYAKIYSEPGHGTTVKLYLPRFYGPSEGAEQAQPEITDEHRSLHGETVLVVEDEDAVRALVVDVLEELGYRAIEAADGAAGLRIAQSDARIDLLVTDVGLPGMNGRDLATKVREVRPDLGVLFITGYAENAAIAGGFLDPGMRMITKPFSIETLATRIRDMIEKK